MKTIRISQAVWDEIAKLGKFGETPDDVLRRKFNLVPAVSDDDGFRKRAPIDRAKRRMSARVTDDGYLLIEFLGGQSNKWKLPSKHDKNGIRRVKGLAIEFAQNNEASLGQINAVVKAMTDAEYWTTK
jgi:hypothetical protein